MTPFDSKLWQLQRSLIPWSIEDLFKSHKFKFGHIELYDTYKDIAGKVIDDKIFRLPFSISLYEMDMTIDKIPLPLALLCKEVEDDRSIEIFPMNYDKLTGWISPVNKPFKMNILASNPIQRLASNACAVATLALSANCFVQKYVIVPTQLQKARERARKIPLFDFRIIELNLSNEARKTHVGTHASPMLHWRRGHFRCAYGRIFPVRATLVGTARNGVVQKSYNAENLHD